MAPHSTTELPLRRAPAAGLSSTCLALAQASTHLAHHASRDPSAGAGVLFPANRVTETVIECCILGVASQKRGNPPGPGSVH